jgi:AbiV family abortive infection protein
LVDEAELLLAHDAAARAFALAFTALEEIGKSQLVADFFNDQVSEAEVAAAFRSHHIKLAYLDRRVRIDGKLGSDATIEYDTAALNPLATRRHDALYVNHGAAFKPQEPSALIDPGEARDLIDTAIRELHAIEHAEELNGRIGSKGLFK